MSQSDPVIDPSTIEPNLFKTKEEKVKKKLPWLKGIVFFLIGAGLLGFIAVKGLMSFIPKATGEVRAVSEVILEARIEGYLKEVVLKPSQKVNKGETLLEFENANLDLELKNAQKEKEGLEAAQKEIAGRLDYSKKGLERGKVLSENGIISQFEYEGIVLNHEKLDLEFSDIRHGLEEIGFRIAHLENDKESLWVKAPFDGIFLGELANKGNTFFKKGDDLGLFFNPNDFYVEASFLEKEAARIHLGKRAEVTFKAFGGVYLGEVTDIEERAYEKTEKVYKINNVVKVKISLNNFPLGLKPGMKGEVRIL